MGVSIKSSELELITNTFVFDGVDKAVLLEAMAGDGCLTMDYEKEATVFSPQDYFRALGVVLSGRLIVSKGGPEHAMTISHLSRGEVFGAAAIFNEYHSFATTIVAECDSRVIYFGEELLKNIMSTDFRAVENYIRYQAGRIRFLSSKIDGLSAGSADQRLARYLLDSGVKASSMTELAGMLNMGRASLYRAIDALGRAGAVKKTGKGLEILDKQRLIQFINGEPE